MIDPIAVSESVDPKKRVLLVDDNEALGRACARMLVSAGFDVDIRLDGEEALNALKGGSYDLILSDIQMPRMGGIEMLQQVRSTDLDVPVIFMTGNPSLETAIQAIDRGAMRYLIKPIQKDDLVKTARDAVSWHRLAKAKRMALALAGGVDRFVGDDAALVASFDRALATMFVVYQPIVAWSKRTVFGYEALLRSREPRLPHPGAILDAAEKLGRVHELSRLIRARAVAPLAAAAGDFSLFVNLHPEDLLDGELYSDTSPIAVYAKRVVLEITERASLSDIKDVRTRIARLRAMGFRIAVDDLGAGYAGLTAMAQLEPDVAKLDMSLIRDVHLEPKKLVLVRTMIAMCGELRVDVIVEGVEAPEERDALADSGSDLMQGYLFARPGDPFPTPSY